VHVNGVDVTYEHSGQRSSVDAFAAALSAAAAYRSPVRGIVAAVVVGSLIGWIIDEWLALFAAIVGVGVIAVVAKRAERRRRLLVSYEFDSAGLRIFESLSNGVAWLASSRAVWLVTHEEPASAGGKPRSVHRADTKSAPGAVPNLTSNVTVQSIAGGGEVLHFLPDTLLVRSRDSQVIDVPYPSIHVTCESTEFTENGFVPPDSRVIRTSWLYANKNGNPDRRRAANRQIPVLEYTRVTLTWRNSGCVLLVSNMAAARHFANAVRVRSGAAELSPAPRPAIANETMPAQKVAAPTDLERALQASIDRRTRLAELERHAVAATSARPARIQPETSRGAAEWIAAGATKQLHGFTTRDFVYIGSQVRSLEGSIVEPSLIDPSLPVDPSHANVAGDGVDYWPSYKEISSASRRAFLQWLSEGRQNPAAHIGYVFIFFYGLERRVYEYVQGRSSNADEVLSIGREVARLLELYGASSGSFETYASGLLDLIAALEPRARELTADRGGPMYGPSQRLRSALGELSLAGRPIPAKLALEWVVATSYLNTPATRCADEFELLFHVRYAKQFDEGMIVKPSKAQIDLSYRPASAGLDPLVMKRSVPDVTQLSRPIAKLTALARECSEALDPFSRFLGKNPGGRDSLAAFALLPEELVEATSSQDAVALASLVSSRLDDAGHASLAAAELLPFVRLAKPDRVSKSEAVLLAQALEKLGYGIEPDVRLGGPVYETDGRVLVFRRLPDCPSAASEEYALATLLMRLAVTVSAANDAGAQAERNLLERHIEERLRLTPGERQRLSAHLVWLLDVDLGMTGLKRRIESLTPDARHAVGKLLIEVAATDGHVDAREMKILEKLYAVLELPSSDLYRDVHAAQIVDDEPIAVQQPEGKPKGFAIPAKPAPAPVSKSTGIDMERVRLKIAETRQVSTLLSAIFEEEEARAVVAAPPAASDSIGTLDPAHSEFLRRLAGQESWSREDIERIARELALMPDGALETINDYAYATADAPLWEDDDPVAINLNVARELTA
jgi:tellurite resistance protein